MPNQLNPNCIKIQVWIGRTPEGDLASISNMNLSNLSDLTQIVPTWPDTVNINQRFFVLTTEALRRAQGHSPQPALMLVTNMIPVEMANNDDTMACLEALQEYKGQVWSNCRQTKFWIPRVDPALARKAPSWGGKAEPGSDHTAYNWALLAAQAHCPARECPWRSRDPS